MPEHDDALIEKVAEHLREPVRLDPQLDARIMADIESLTVQRKERRSPGKLWELLRRRYTVTVTPLGGLAAAAGVVAIVLTGWLTATQGRDAAPATIAAQRGAEPETTLIQFVVVAGTASSVSLVGDFNDWDVSATPMWSGRDESIWSVAVPLPPGRYRYSFLVDGERWLPDPLAPVALADDFGRPNSVITVGG